MYAKIKLIMVIMLFKQLEFSFLNIESQEYFNFNASIKVLGILLSMTMLVK